MIYIAIEDPPHICVFHDHLPFQKCGIVGVKLLWVRLSKSKKNFTQFQLVHSEEKGERRKLPRVKLPKFVQLLLCIVSIVHH